MKDSSEARFRLLTARAEARARRSFSWILRTKSPAPEALLVAGIALVLLYATRSMWFFGDDWKFLIERRDLWNHGHRVAFLFDPHNEHLSTLPAVTFLVLESVFGLGSAFPFMVVVVAGHVAILWAVRTALVRAHVGMVGRIVALGWLGFFGAGAEDLVWPFQLGFIWGLAFSLWGLLLVLDDRSTVRRNALASLLFLLGLFTAGTAIAIVVVGGVSLMCRMAWRRAVYVFAVPVAAYGAWYVLYGKSRMPKHPTALTQVIPYLTRGVSFGLDQTVAFAGLGLVLGFGALVVLAVVPRFATIDRRIAVALASSIGVFYLLGGIGRGYFGPEQATAGRYVYICGALSIPVLVVVADRIVGIVPKILPVVGVLVLIAILGNIGMFVAERDQWFARSNAQRGIIELAALHARAPITDPHTIPDPTYNPDVNMGGLAELEAAGMWPPQPEFTTKALLEGSLQFGVLSATTPFPPDAAAHAPQFESVQGGEVTRTSSECFQVHPTSAVAELILADGVPGVFSVDNRGGTVGLYLRAPSGERSTTKPLVSNPVGPTWVGLWPASGQAVVTVPSGTDPLVCGLTGP
jgi:hypothetical protein